MPSVVLGNWWRTVTLCGRWRLQVNSLWRWWYCLIGLGVHAYLVYRAVELCKDYNQLPWPTDRKPVTELYVCIAFIVISVMCVPFYVITAVFKVGNYANDGRRLGRESGASLKDEVTGFWQVLWRHSGPLCQGCHLVATFCLLFPPVLLQAQQIKHSFISPENIWTTDLSVLFHQDGYLSADENNPSISDLIQKNLTEMPLQPSPPSAMSPEFVTYLVVMVIYSLSYASVFWYTKMAFSLIFSLILIVSNIHGAFSFCTMSILYKFRKNEDVIDGKELVLPSSVILVLYLVANTVIHFSMIPVFNYGYLHFLEDWKKFITTNFPILSSQVNAKKPNGCHGYCPHVIATFVLVLVVGCRAPIVYDCVLLYRNNGMAILLAGIIVDVAYMILWVVMWLSLTVKEKWQFKILLTGEFEREISELTPAVYIHGSDNDPLSVDSDNSRDAVIAKIDHVPVAPNGVPQPASPRSNSDKHSPAGAQQTSDPPSAKAPKRKWDGTKAENVEHAQNVNSVVRRARMDTLPQKDENLEPESTPESTMTKNYRLSVRERCGQYYYRDNDEHGADDPSHIHHPSYRYSTEVVPHPSDLERGYPVQRRGRSASPEGRDHGRVIKGHAEGHRRQVAPTYQRSADRLTRDMMGPPPPYKRHAEDLEPELRIAREPNPNQRSREISPSERYTQNRSRNIPQPQDLSDSIKTRHLDDNVHRARPREIPPSSRYSRGFTDNAILDVNSLRENVGDHSLASKDAYKNENDLNKRLNKPEASTSQTAYYSKDILPSNISASQPQASLGQISFVDNGLRKEEEGSSSVSDTPPELPPRNKPFLVRRDSALPSSNDTSSSDSHDVLCSQV